MIALISLLASVSSIHAEEIITEDFKSTLFKDFSISIGTEYEFMNYDGITHTITSGNPYNGPDGLFDSGLLRGGESFFVSFDNIGDIEYFCLIHPWLHGTITVIEQQHREETQIGSSEYSESSEPTEVISQIPQWVKVIFQAWAQGQLSDTELFNAITFLVETGVIILP